MFKIGFQCGLKPEEVLDCNLERLKAVISGYSERLYDYQKLAIQTGYWGAYYSHAKHPKPITSIVAALDKQRMQKQKSGKVETTEADVEAFLEMERLFNETLNSTGGSK